MNELKKIQQSFQNILLGKDSQFLNMVEDLNISLNPIERINIYADGYKARLLEALIANYSILYNYIGRDKFKKIATLCSHAKFAHASFEAKAFSIAWSTCFFSAK